MACGDRASIVGIVEEAVKPGELTLDLAASPIQSITFLDVCGVNGGLQSKTEDVGDRVTLPSVKLLAGIIVEQTMAFTL